MKGSHKIIKILGDFFSIFSLKLFYKLNLLLNIIFFCQFH